jgi:hypothetical protein
MNRRNFLKRSGGGILFLGGMSMINACDGLTRNDLSQFDDKEELIKGLDKGDLEILYLASFAPSGHNTQPWTVKIVDPNRWIIGSDKMRWLPAVDPENQNMSQVSSRIEFF